MILLGLFTTWRAVHSEYYASNKSSNGRGERDTDDATTTTSSSTTSPPTAATPLLPLPRGGGDGDGDVEAGPTAKQARAQASSSSAAAAFKSSSRLLRRLRSLRERMLATLVGTVHGVAGGCVP